MRSSPLALTILWMLAGGPLHPYAIQTRLKAWGKDQVVNVGQRANLHKTIERLKEAGLVAVRQTERDQRFPERTVYELTEEGMRVARDWLAAMLSTPRNEFPEFPVALSFVFGLAPGEVIEALEARAKGLRAQVAGLKAVLEDPAGPPRLYLIETEFIHRVAAAELDWVSAVIEDLRSGRLTWSRESIAEDVRRFPPPQE